MQTTFEVLRQLLTSFNPAIIPQFIEGYRTVFALILLGFFLHFLPLSWKLAVERLFIQTPWALKGAALAGVIWLAIQAAGADVVPFIYFQF